MPEQNQHPAKTSPADARRRLRAADLTVHIGTGPGRQHIGLLNVMTVAAVAGLAGWGLLAVLERSTRNPRRTWTICSLVALVASLAGPASARAHPGTLAALPAMHFAVAAALIPTRRRTSRAARQRSAIGHSCAMANGGGW